MASGSAQLRMLNSLISQTLGGRSAWLQLPTQSVSPKPLCAASAFGVSGTIAHAVISHAQLIDEVNSQVLNRSESIGEGAPTGTVALPVYRRCAFTWYKSPPHSSAQCSVAPIAAKWEQMRTKLARDPVHRRSLTEARVREVLVSIFADLPDMATPLGELGVDSIASLELLSRLRDLAPPGHLGLEVLLTNSASSADDIIHHLLEIPVEVEAAPQSSPEPVGREALVQQAIEAHSVFAPASTVRLVGRLQVGMGALSDTAALGGRGTSVLQRSCSARDKGRWCLPAGVCERAVVQWR